MTPASVAAGNIGPRERRKRWILGFVVLAASVAAWYELVIWGQPRWTRLALAAPVWFAALCVIQARRET